MMVNDPYVLVKYVYITRNTINVKQLRLFFSFMVKEDLFDRVNLLEFGKRMFFIIFKTIVRNKNIETMIDTFKPIPLHNVVEMDKIEDVKSELEKKFALSIDRLKAKLKFVLQFINKRKAEGTYNDELKIKNIRKRLEHPRSKEGLYEYPFADSDDTPQSDETSSGRVVPRTVSVIKKFDSQFQRYLVLSRVDDSLKAFISIEEQKKRL